MARASLQPDSWPHLRWSAGFSGATGAISALANKERAGPWGMGRQISWFGASEKEAAAILAFGGDSVMAGRRRSGRNLFAVGAVKLDNTRLKLFPVLNEVPTVSHEQINQHLSNWTDRESTAEAMIPLIGRLRSEEHTSELQSRPHLVCRLLLE